MKVEVTNKPKPAMRTPTIKIDPGINEKLQMQMNIKVEPIKKKQPVLWEVK